MAVAQETVTATASYPCEFLRDTACCSVYHGSHWSLNLVVEGDAVALMSGDLWR
jgi:hypothetical protein